jgi:hypothetical protein
MVQIIVGIFAFLHGTVHLLYAGHSKRIFEMAQGMAWPDGSVVDRALGTDVTRLLAAALLVMADMAFTLSGVGLLLDAGWWRLALPAASVFSSAVFLVFWNGRLDSLPSQGAVGILINIGLIGFSVGW